MTRTLASLALLVALAACGGREALKPVDGQGTPPVARGMSDPMTAQQMMSASSQARPQRNAELLTRSQERADDEFDLPPEN